jgi:hypothetical protein
MKLSSARRAFFRALNEFRRPGNRNRGGTAGGLFSFKRSFAVEKTLIMSGHEINRPSLIEVSVNGDEIKVGGKCNCR